MLALRVLGFRGLLFLGLGILAVAAVVRRRWRNSVAKDEEVLRLLAMASEETAMAELEASSSYGFAVETRPVLQCVVCYCPTTRRCSQCKSVRYCSGKCQIAHWRQGHKDECHYIRMQFEMTSNLRSEDSSCDEERMQTDVAPASACCDSEDDSSSDHASGIDSNNRLEKQVSDVIDQDLLASTTKLKESESTKLPPADYASLVNSVNCGSPVDKSNTMDIPDEKVKSSLHFNKAKIAKHDNGLPATNPSIKKLTKATPLAEKLTIDDMAKAKRSSLTKDEDSSRVLKGKEIHGSSATVSNYHQPPSIGENAVPSSKSAKADDFHTLPVKTGSVPALPQNTRNGLKTSMRKVVQQFRASKPSKCDSSIPGTDMAGKHKLIFPYELFVNLYTDDVVLGPFGLTNCGNSCYANAVLQCLAFTRPFTSYLLQELHSKACQKKDWCFVCEFEYLIHKAREGTSPVSPIRILSKLHKIGSHLGHGKEEDAHEFLRYAVDTMQSVFLGNAGAVGPLAEESTLVGMTFGGYLLSKIKCMRCLGKSERSERMMDLTVEIDGEIGTLEEALAQFTATETLDRDNKYHCNRCKSYEKARKKLTVLEAPNILTIVLKRFKSGNFEKLSKSVRFPEVLDIAPYMSRASGRPPLYILYAVVVHLDCMTTAFSGHYVCYVKNIQGKWFKIDDSSVQAVQLERVLSEGTAYMLLYARRTPRPPAMLGGDMVTQCGKSKKRITEEVSKPKSKSHHPAISTSDPHDWRRVRGADSLSESSSIFSSSDAGSSSTVSTKGSASTDDFSDYIFGDQRYGSHWPGTELDAGLQGSSNSWRSRRSSGWEFERKEENPAILYSETSRRRRKSSSSEPDYFLWANPFDVRTGVPTSRRSAQTIL